MSHDRFRFGLVGAGYVLAAVLFFRLPVLGLHGRPFSVWSWPWLATCFTLPTAALAIVLIFRSLAKHDPFRANYARFRRSYDLILDLAVLLALVTHLLILTKIMILQGVAGPWVRFVPTAFIGLVLIVVGNVLPRVRPNSAIGVRTRWTLRDEAVWARTHRAAGYFLVVFGLTLVVWTFVDFLGIWWVLGPGTILTVAGLPALSYIIWKRRPRSRPVDAAADEHTK